MSSCHADTSASALSAQGALLLAPCAGERCSIVFECLPAASRSKCRRHRRKMRTSQTASTEIRKARRTRCARKRRKRTRTRSSRKRKLLRCLHPPHCPSASRRRTMLRRTMLLQHSLGNAPHASKILARSAGATRKKCSLSNAMVVRSILLTFSIRSGCQSECDRSRYEWLVRLQWEAEVSEQHRLSF